MIYYNFTLFPEVLKIKLKYIFLFTGCGKMRVLREEKLEDLLLKVGRYLDLKGLQGEYDFLTKAKKFADKKTDVIYDPIIGKEKPDFLLYHEDFGFIFAEVKNWSLNNIKKVSPNGSISFQNSSHNPLSQAQSHKSTFVGLLNTKINSTQDFFPYVNVVVYYSSFTKDEFIEKFFLNEWNEKQYNDFFRVHFFKDTLNTTFHDKLKIVGNNCSRMKGQSLTTGNLDNLYKIIAATEKHLKKNQIEITQTPFVQKSKIDFDAQPSNSNSNFKKLYLGLTLSAIFLLIMIMIEWNSDSTSYDNITSINSDVAVVEEPETIIESLPKVEPSNIELNAIDSSTDDVSTDEEIISSSVVSQNDVQIFLEDFFYAYVNAVNTGDGLYLESLDLFDYRGDTFQEMKEYIVTLYNRGLQQQFLSFEIVDFHFSSEEDIEVTTIETYRIIPSNGPERISRFQSKYRLTYLDGKYKIHTLYEVQEVQ
jgi:hypothetical protein